MIICIENKLNSSSFLGVRFSSYSHTCIVIIMCILQLFISPTRSAFTVLCHSNGKSLKVQYIYLFQFCSGLCYLLITGAVHVVDEHLIKHYMYNVRILQVDNIFSV